MPDHVHVILAGASDQSDQRIAVEYLRKHLSAALKPACWQKQPHDHVLRDSERKHDAFQTIAHYIFENPVRANLVSHWQDYPFAGCMLPGYPDIGHRTDSYWNLFWRIYNRCCEPRLAHARRYE